jgi:hypothetical protein
MYNQVCTSFYVNPFDLGIPSITLNINCYLDGRGRDVENKAFDVQEQQKLSNIERKKYCLACRNYG